MEAIVQYPYGAWEQKCYYQKHMLMGIGSAALLMVLIIVSVWLYRVITYEDVGGTTRPIHITIAQLGQPPSFSSKLPQPAIAKPDIVMKKVGIPTPVADEEIADEDVVIATQDELKEIAAPAIAAMADQSQELVIDIPEEDQIPASNVFVAVERQPVQIREEQPKYPVLALAGGFTAKVTIEAYVGKDGKVKKAQAVKCTRLNMGFEEAAIAAAYLCEYSPAIQNGNPVAVWIAYTVQFTLVR
ncbi:MAG: TonB family protein [Patescibacteria group bacterium]|nr:TonB family protein [Patescibacteria group bacterium]MDD5715656.1 TonB family protein [Patescibacteria group bacterium]